MTALVLRSDAERPAEPGWVSGSALATAVRCAASLVLPRILGITITQSKIGSALHAHMQHRVHYGIQGAVEMLEETARAFDLDEDETSIFIVRARSFEWTPPKGAISEMALCLFEDGRVEAVKGGKGIYDVGPDALIPAQIDMFWSEPEPLYFDAERRRVICPPGSVLWVIDFKSGKEDYVEDADRNPQVLAAAVLAAKFIEGVTIVRPGIVYIRKGTGIWNVTDGPIDLATLAEVEKILVRAVYDVRAARDAHKRGLPLVYREGPHCAFCRARHACPAHVGTLRHWLSDPAPIEPGALNDEQVQKLAELAPAFRRFAKSVDDALREHVLATGKPIPLSDGRVWGAKTKPIDVFDPEKVVAVLEEEFAEGARAAVKSKVSKASIEKVIVAAHARKGIAKMKASALRRIYAKLADNGGVRKITRVEYGPHKPSAQLPPTSERHATIAAMQGLPIDGDDLEDEETDE